MRLSVPTDRLAVRESSRVGCDAINVLVAER